MEENKKLQYLATFAVALASMTGSVSFSWSTPVIPKFHNNETDIKLTDTEISWVVAISAPGSMMGCVVSQFTCDVFGRRTTLLGSALPFFIGTIFVAISTKAWMLYVARFCWGIGVGLITPTTMMYVSEIAAKEIRGNMSVVLRFMINFGALLVITVGSVASYQALSYMLVALSAGYFVACWIIPETPYFLLKEGKIARAKKALKKLNGYKDEQILDEKVSDMRSHVQKEMKNSGTLKELLTGARYRKAIFISIGLWITHLNSGYIPLQQYIGRILQETNSDISVSTGMVVYNALRFALSMVASQMIDKVGRRPLLIFSYIGAFLTLTSLGTIFFFYEVLNKTPPYFGYLTLGFLLLSTTVTTLGFETVNFVIMAEIFPLNVKATAMTSITICLSFANFFIIRGYQILKDFGGLHVVFWFYASFAIGGALFSYFVVPETKGKSLREIQLQLQGELYGEASEQLTKEGHEDDTPEKITEKSEVLKLKT